MNNYIVINGKKTELTEEQLEKLGINVEKENPFAKRINNELYYYISARGIIESETQEGDCIDTCLYNNANYFNEKDFAQQVALHQLLNRKLLKYAYDNEAEDCKWDEDGANPHYYIYFYNTKGYFVVEANHYCRSQNTISRRKTLLNKQLKKHIKESLEFYLDSHEENGVVYIPKFIVEKIIEELK